jgi:glycosyltransferase involved in cell wall biosynthesis
MVMIMDIIAEKYPRLTLPTYRARMFWKAKVALGRWQADLIVTLSEYSRLGIIEHFQVAPERVAVVGAASAPVFRVMDDPHPTTRLDSLGIRGNGRTIVYVGGFGPHKNLEALVAAFSQLAPQDAFSDARLILAGEYEKEVFHSSFQSIKRQIADLGINDRVLFTGYLPDKDLVVLLNLATVLVLPSLMEGFGLPAIEAASCGCPVIATTASPLPALLGDGGLYLDPTRPEDLELALIRVLSSESLRQRMRAAGLSAASELTWDAAARRMMVLMREVMVQ